MSQLGREGVSNDLGGPSGAEFSKTKIRDLADGAPVRRKWRFFTTTWAAPKTWPR
jgi:hypothetical protein